MALENQINESFSNLVTELLFSGDPAKVEEGFRMLGEAMRLRKITLDFNDLENIAESINAASYSQKSEV